MSEEKDEKKSYTKTLRDYFGLREGDKLADFAEELKALSPEEKEQLGSGIENGSLTY